MKLRLLGVCTTDFDLQFVVTVSEVKISVWLSKEEVCQPTTGEEKLCEAADLSNVAQ